jgi:hypothetical protein
VASDDWRIRIELGGEAERAGLLERLKGGLGEEGTEIAGALEGEHVAVSRDGDELYVYAATRAQARHARAVLESELRRHGLEATIGRVEHWLEDEERWDDEPKEETWEQREVEHGWAPWEVRIGCASHGEAVSLAERLESEGFRPARRWRYLVVGTDTREQAEQLAKRLHGEVEPGGEVIWEEAAAASVVSPFRIFG